MAVVDEVISEFLVESRENLDQLDRDLVHLEEDPTNSETLGSIFRTIHTIKGTCGFLGFNRLQSITHAGESLLSLLRDGTLVIDAELTSALLELVDAVREALAVIAATGEEGEGDGAPLIERLTQLQQHVPNRTPAAEPAPAAAEPPAEPPAEPSTEPSTGAAEPAASEPEAPAAPPPAAPAPKAARARAKRSPRTARKPADEEAAAPAAPETPTVEEGAPTMTDSPPPVAPPASDTRPAAAVAAPAPDPAAKPAASLTPASDSSVRVDVGLLDDLMNLVGELVLARNQILQQVADRPDSGFAGPAQRLNLITTELQEGVMKTRMQPIGNVWNKLPRVVRDLSLSCAKQVRLEMDGADTELDRTIIEAIKDPLTHLVRNAIDHGLETPEERRSAGKPVEGRLLLRAFHESGKVTIEISDDGGGIDVEKIRAKAIERGTVSAEQASRMGPREVLSLIFQPGFSTATTVTSVSGRGVGMDVVKTNIERIGGSVDVDTQLGRGTTFMMKIPLTLAIIPALVVTTMGSRYAIPQISLLELVRLEGGEKRTGIELIQGVPVHRLRGRLLPVIDLEEELGGPRCLADREVINMVVLQADDRQFGLVVDEINDTQEIVVKPLGRQVKDLSVFAGATIMGDGRVALILDVLGLAQRAHVISEARERALAEEQARLNAEGDHEITSHLVVACGEGRRAAVPLAAVERLDEVDPASIEIVSGREVVQYRGAILPLVRMDDVLGVHGGYGEARSGNLDVVVLSANGRHVGLVVDGIVDIVDHVLDGSRSAVLGGRVTELVDPDELVPGFDPAFAGR